MRWPELLVVYALIGVVVTVAAWRLGRPGAWLGIALWPLVLPGLLSRPVAGPPSVSPDARIHRAVQGLREALDGWEEVPEGLPSLSDIEVHLARLAQRVGRIAAALASVDATAQEPVSEAVRPLVQARLSHVARLRELQIQGRSDLEHALAALAEIAARVQLSRWTGDETGSVARDLVRLARMVDAATER